MHANREKRSDSGTIDVSFESVDPTGNGDSAQVPIKVRTGRAETAMPKATSEQTAAPPGEGGVDAEDAARIEAEKKEIAAAVQKVFFSLLAALEFAMRGNLLWTPVALVLSEVVARLLPKFQALPLPTPQAPNRSEPRYGSNGRVADLMATGTESPVWMPVFLDTWWCVIERMVSRNVISTLQLILDREVPPAISLQVNQFYLGKTPPQCTNIQAYYRPGDGGMEIFELDVIIDSKDMSIIISGTAPVVGKLQITMTDFDVMGRVQLWTLPNERMVLIGFKTRPQLKIGMRLNVARQTVDAYRMLCAPIENIIYQSISELVEGRRRVLVPLEIEPPDGARGEAVDGNILIRVLACSGLPAGSELNRFQVTARNSNLQVARRSRIKKSLQGKPTWKEQKFVLRTGDKVGTFYLDVEELSSGMLIGTAVVSAAALDDGCTGFWAAGRDGGPLAKRWTNRSAPWRVTVPLENAQGQVIPDGEITVELSAVRWLTKQSKPPSSINFSTPGPRSVVLRILEAHNVGNTRAGTRLVQVKYNNQTEETQLVANSNHPVWNRTFVFAENPSVATRKMRLKVLSARSMAGLEKDLGFTYINLDSIYEGQQYDSWIELGGTPRGRLHVVADIVPGLPSSEQVRKLAATQWVPAYSPSLKVEIVEARDLSASDLDGSSDPYCFLVYGSASTQTQVVPKNLNPTFAHKAVMPLRKPGELLKLKCMDYDFLRSDDPLGGAEVDVAKLLPEDGKEVEVWVKLQGARPDMFAGEGEVLLRLSRVGSFADVLEDSSSSSLEDDEGEINVLADSYYSDS